MTIDIKDIKQNHYTESGFKQFDPVIGDHTKNVCEALEKKVGIVELLKQLGKALEIMSFITIQCTKRSKHSRLSRGKSSIRKTTSFSIYSLAADNGYKIIQLLGTTNLLVDDNFKDVKKVLGLDGDNNLDWCIRFK